MEWVTRNDTRIYSISAMANKGSIYDGSPCDNHTGTLYICI
jgi:hypothetical protein